MIHEHQGADLIMWVGKKWKREYTDAVYEVRRHRSATASATARSLGVTRECLYK